MQRQFGSNRLLLGALAVGMLAGCARSTPSESRAPAGSAVSPSTKPEGISSEKKEAAPADDEVSRDKALTELEELDAGVPGSCKESVPRAEQICRLAESICRLDDDGGPHIASTEGETPSPLASAPPLASSTAPAARTASSECFEAKGSCERARRLVRDGCSSGKE